MALARMDVDPTERTRGRERLPITTATCVSEARAGMAGCGERAAIVYQSGRPAGVVTVDALARATECGHDDALVTSVMDYVTVHVDRTADAFDTVRTFTNAAWAWLRGRHV